MISDAERREVARRLRGIDFGDVLFDSELVDAIEYVCGSKRKRRDFVKIVDRLADLIEPSGHECVPGECPINVRHDNDRIDRDALLALADEMLSASIEISSVDSMRPLEAAYLIQGYARRIREALGVES